VKVTAAVLDQVGSEFTFKTLDLADPGPGEVLIEVAGVGVCHTDLAVQHGHLPFPFPAVLGHEGSGVVKSVGPGVTKVVGPERECLFGYVGQDTWVSVALWQGVDPAAARAYYNASKALIPPSFTIAELPNFHGGAVIARSPNHEDTGIYVIDGSNVFNVACVLMRPPCSDVQLEAGANFVVGRLP